MYWCDILTDGVPALRWPEREREVEADRREPSPAMQQSTDREGRLAALRRSARFLLAVRRPAHA